MSSPLLAMEDVHLRRGDATIVAGVNWQVKPHEHWALLGPNGSGKTSLIMMAVGYVPASRGRIHLIEDYISRIVLRDVRRRVGVVSSALSDAMLTRHARTSGLEVAASGRFASLGLYERPSAEDLARAEGFLTRLGGARLLALPFCTMSTGERQICLIARCYVADSDLVILDEPCAGLDIPARETVLGALQSACANPDSPAHILITHHPSEIVPGITHVLLMSGGRVAAQGVRGSVLTEGNLSAAYGLPLTVEHAGGRVWVRPASAPAVPERSSRGVQRMCGR